MMARQIDRAALAQLLRYAVAGGGITLASAIGYWLLATPMGLDPALALSIVFVIFTGIGFVLHGQVSFRGHGGRDRPSVRTLRYFIVNILGFGLNQAFIWLLVTRMGGETWWPIVPMVMITPFATFLLHRRWVYA